MSVDGPSKAPPPNWYPDPMDPRLLRYWNGAQWTEQTAPMTFAGTPSAPAPPSRGSKKRTWVVLTAIFGGLVFISVILAAVAVPVFLNQRQKAADASARSDLSTLARAIAIWYVDNDGPLPAVEVSGDQYYVDGLPAGTVSPGVVLGGATGTGPSDWCVWATNPEGSVKSFEYSAERGPQAGTC